MKTIIIDGIEYNLTPKVLFKKGDFVVIQETTYQITKVENLNVTLSLNGRECLFDIDVLKNARLWDITKDAKDGDVLADDYGIYIFEKFDECDRNCYVCIGAYQYSQKVYECEHMLCSTDAHPATKEQCDLLFQKMGEAGYEWDAEKKELKKIEFSPDDLIEENYQQQADDLIDMVTEKPAWSEEVQEEPVSEDLEEAAQEYTEKGSKCQEELDAFKAGAKWQKEQMMAKAVDGVVTFDYYEGDKAYGCVAHDSFCLEDLGLKDRDEVKILILKK